MRHPATLLLICCCALVVFFGCSGPQSNVSAPEAPGLHAPEGVLVGGTEVTDTAEATDEPDASAAATESKETSTSRRDQGSDCGSAVAMHTIEVASKTKLKKDENASIPISVKGGSGQFKWFSITFSDLPAGMSFTGEGRGERTASITGTPIQPGTLHPVIKVRDELCKRDAEKQITILVPQVGEATPAAAVVDIEGAPEKPAVRLIYNTLDENNTQEIFLYEDKPQDAPNFRNFIQLIAQPHGESGNDYPIPADRYKLSYRYYHTFQKPDGSAGSEGCNAFYANTHSGCYLELENGAKESANGIPRVDEITEYEFVVVDTQDKNKTYRYLLYGKKGCKTLNLSDTHLLLKIAYNKLSDSGYCYSGGDYHVTWAGAGLGNMQHHLWVTDDKNQWLRGGMYRTSYKLTSEGNDNLITTNPKQVIWGPADRQVPATVVDARCLEEIDMFGLWFKEGGCAGSAPDFRVAAIEVKACLDDDDLRREGGDNCYYASYYKEGDYLGWNSVSNYGECMGNFNFDRIPNTNLATWSLERDLQVVDLFNALGVLY